MSEECKNVLVKAPINFTITLRDDDSEIDFSTKIGIFGNVRRNVMMAMCELLTKMGYEMNNEKDLDHNQDLTDNLQKSEKPDKSYMDEKELCPKCHGPKHEGECPVRK